MKVYLVLALLVAGFFQAVPKQADKPQLNHSDGKHPPDQPPKPAAEGAGLVNASPPGPSSEKKDDSANNKVKEPSWYQKITLPVLSNWPLIAVAIWGILVARSTLKVVERQAVSMRRQTTHLKNSVIQSRDAAQAARKSADALISSERAWVIAEIEWQQGAHIFEGSGTDGESTGIYVDFICVNQGRSFAQVVEKGYVFKIVDVLPAEPDFSDIDIFHYASVHQTGQRLCAVPIVGHSLQGTLPTRQIDGPLRTG
jgi:hypothetical protein